jgi:Sulfotransferase family
MRNLFIVGAQRCGSTYLYHLLDEHPEVMMARPLQPEPKFFLNSDLVHRGANFYEESYFSHPPPTLKYYGEKSTSYLEYPLIARRIRQFFPSARILIILRDPVWRAWSNYLFTVRHELEELSFSDALYAEAARIHAACHTTSVNPFAYRQRGYFIDYIEPYLAVFPKEQIYTLILEELVSDQSRIRSLYQWLEIDPDVLPASRGLIVNASAGADLPSEELLEELATGYARSLRGLEQFLGRRLHLWRRNRRYPD